MMARSLPVERTLIRRSSPWGLSARQSVNVPPVSTQSFQRSLGAAVPIDCGKITDWYNQTSNYVAEANNYEEQLGSASVSNELTRGPLPRGQHPFVIEGQGENYFGIPSRLRG
ncbi:MAG: hypothetical protein M2R45_05373 [Verrucomicrobia subdivision 3 bacterium]|nr:hypothetical protein [Limisphaerales bacterium]